MPRRVCTLWWALLLLAVAATVGASPAAAGPTRGSGGERTDRLNQEYVDDEGRWSQYHLFAARVPSDRPVGLVVHFHGNGGFGFRDPLENDYLGGPDGVLAAARDRDMLTLSIRTPDRDGGTWHERGAENARYVRGLLRDEVYPRYDVDTERVWLVGYSSGAQFITESLLPVAATVFDGGGAVMFAGGGPPGVGFRPVSRMLRADFPLHWHQGAQDARRRPFDPARETAAGSRWYAEHGWPTTVRVDPERGHGWTGEFGRIVGSHLDQHAADPPARALQGTRLRAV